MRRAARTDSNQTEIVKALRAIGCSVQSLAAVGKGCPDLLVGWQGRNVLMEIKDGDKCPSARKLTEDETRWHAGWKGRVFVVKDVAGAIAAVQNRQAGVAKAGYKTGQEL